MLDLDTDSGNFSVIPSVVPLTDALEQAFTVFSVNPMLLFMILQLNVSSCHIILLQAEKCI